MKIDLLKSYSHDVIHSKGDEGSVDGVDAMCYGEAKNILAGSHEHTQSYSGSGPAEAGDSGKNGQEDIMPAVPFGSYPLPSSPDKGVDNKSKGGANPTEAMPGA